MITKEKMNKDLKKRTKEAVKYSVKKYGKTYKMLEKYDELKKFDDKIIKFLLSKK